ncbi:hypothetical protein ACIO3O_09265 [Streptomyces sp. NPDC087440]|uniref:hypothetical protein n=1 Tax=Streptomyces sp. NPDC087440 TaxID=3365790 RepID=UPI00381462CC
MTARRAGTTGVSATSGQLPAEKAPVGIPDTQGTDTSDRNRPSWSADRCGRRVQVPSGSFWWPDTDPAREPKWLAAEFARTDRRPGVRFRLEAGAQEWMLRHENRRMLNAPPTGGHDVTYGEFNGGHDDACRRSGPADGPARLLA